jgi:hypothetical protein
MTTSGKFVLELTPSQKMALTDALLEHIGYKGSTEVFVNCSEEPAVETSIGELIRIITDARYTPAPEEIPDSKTRTA